MPKEIVPSHGPRLYDEDGKEIPQTEQGLVQVGWMDYPIGGVQVATFSRDPISHETKWEGYFVDLDRDGINQLIRYLRRARDRAFGRDE